MYVHELGSGQIIRATLNVVLTYILTAKPRPARSGSIFKILASKYVFKGQYIVAYFIHRILEDLEEGEAINR